MAFHLHIENFRCLRKVDLDLGGVCVLIGPNGAGKSTLLSALRFMSDVLNFGATKAVENAGGGGLVLSRLMWNLAKAPSWLRDDCV